jgi:hypothetical protein
MAAQERLTIHIRLTPALLKRLKLAAVKNDRSLNSEVAYRLERSFSIDDADRDEALKLLADVAAIIGGKMR